MKSPIYSGLAYKFTNVNSFKLTLESETLWFTRGDCFNDPFEANPYLVPIDWKDLIKKKLPREAIKGLANEAFIKISSKIYTSCFSKNYLDKKSHLMWSHYADSHKGLCFELKFNDPDPDSYEVGSPIPISVTYCEDLLDARNSTSINDPDLPLYMTTVKSNIWEYENEVRMIFHSGVYDPSKFMLVNDGRNAKATFNIAEISKVIFGLRASNDDINCVVKKFCDKGHLPDFYKMDIDPISLKLIEVNTGIKEEILKYNSEKGNLT